MNSSSDEMAGTTTEEIVSCENCGNPIDACMCSCPYCGQVDACECCLYDAATGG